MWLYLYHLTGLCIITYFLGERRCFFCSQRRNKTKYYTCKCSYIHVFVVIYPVYLHNYSSPVADRPHTSSEVCVRTMHGIPVPVTWSGHVARSERRHFRSNSSNILCHSRSPGSRVAAFQFKIKMAENGHVYNSGCCCHCVGEVHRLIKKKCHHKAHNKL